MADVSIGLKMWSIDNNIIDQAFQAIADSTFQFIELTPIPGTDITPFVNPAIPYVIHIPPDKYGMNLADPTKQKVNLHLLHLCTEWADELHARYIILHPGHGAPEQVAKFLEEYFDERYLLENMTLNTLRGEEMVGYLPGELANLMADRVGFCFDFSHATKVAIIMGMEYQKFLLEFLPLNPKLFHVSDSHLGNDIDEHLDIGEGEYDWQFLMQCVMQVVDPWITLETPRVKGTLEPNIQESLYLRRLIQSI